MLPAIIWCTFAFAIVCLGLLGFQAFRMQAESDLLRQHVRLTELQLRGREVQIVSEQIIAQAQLRDDQIQISTLVPAQAASGELTACVIWVRTTRQGVLLAPTLAALAEGYEYRLKLVNSTTSETTQLGAFRQVPGPATPFLFQLPEPLEARPRFVLTRAAINRADDTHVELSSRE